MTCGVEGCHVVMARVWVVHAWGPVSSHVGCRAEGMLCVEAWTQRRDLVSCVSCVSMHSFVCGA